MFMIDDEMLYDVIEKTLIPPRGGRWAGVGGRRMGGVESSALGRVM